MLAGRPALVYWRGDESADPPRSQIVLQRALDAVGDSWGPPQVCWDVPRAEGYSGAVWRLRAVAPGDGVGLIVVAGGDYHQFARRVHYLHAAHVGGAFTNRQLAQSDSGYAIVGATVLDGRPAFMGHDLSLSRGEYRFFHANDPAGVSWTSNYVDRFHSVSHPHAFMLAGPRPALLYPYLKSAGSTGLYFRRARPSADELWFGPQALLDSLADFSGLHALNLADGRPAFLYGEDGAWALHVALDELGDNWPESGADIPELQNAAVRASALVAGRPALAVMRDGALHYSPALDAVGSQWAEPERVLGGVDPWEASLTEVYGRPGLAVTIRDGERGYPAFLIHR